MITSSQNKRLKALRALVSGRGQDQATRKAAALLTQELRHADVAADAPLLVLEGPNLIAAALDSNLALPLLVATERFLESGDPVLDRINPSPLAVDEALLNALADADSPRGLLAVATAPESAHQTVLNDPWTTILFLDQLRDPGNVGSVLRVAEATGIDLVALSPGCASWRHPRALRASAGSALRVAIVDEMTCQQLSDEIATITGEPAIWFGLEAGGISVFDEPIATPRVVAIGSEAHGLSTDVADCCSTALAIPMEGKAESMNVGHCRCCCVVRDPAASTVDAGPLSAVSSHLFVSPAWHLPQMETAPLRVVRRRTSVWFFANTLFKLLESPFSRATLAATRMGFHFGVTLPQWLLSLTQSYP